MRLVQFYNRELQNGWDGDYYITCEGNTTGADGRSGSVAIRRRHVKYVQMIIRPDYDGSSSASKPSTGNSSEEPLQ